MRQSPQWCTARVEDYGLVRRWHTCWPDTWCQAWGVCGAQDFMGLFKIARKGNSRKFSVSKLSFQTGVIQLCVVYRRDYENNMGILSEGALWGWSSEMCQALCGRAAGYLSWRASVTGLGGGEMIDQKIKSYLLAKSVALESLGDSLILRSRMLSQKEYLELWVKKL